MRWVSSCAGSGRALQPEPVEAMRTECQEVGQLADRRERRLADQLDWLPSVVCAEIELRRLHEPRKIHHAQQHFISIRADISEYRAIVGVQELQRPPTERAVPLSNP